MTIQNDRIISSTKIIQENVLELKKAKNNNSNWLNKVESDINKTTKSIDRINDKYNLKIKEIEDQSKIYENKFNVINSELNRLRKDIAMKKLYAINISDKKLMMFLIILKRQ